MLWESIEVQKVSTPNRLINLITQDKDDDDDDDDDDDKYDSK